MTRLLIGYDASAASRSAIAVAGSLFPGADATVVIVYPPPPSLEAAALARVALPDEAIREGIARIHADADRRACEKAAEGVECATAAGLRASAVVRQALSAWRALIREAHETEADVLVCGTRGEGPIDRVLLGCTASSLLHHAERPLLVVPAGAADPDGPVLAGYDDSDGARGALRFAAAHLRDRPVLVAHAWRSPVRHSLRGHALAGSHVDMLEDYVSGIDTIFAEVAGETADEGAAFARELGLIATAGTPESGLGDAHALLQEASESGAAAILAGSRGRGALASTVLGSVASGLVHAAERPVLVIPGG
jgi:nucleotide-binding universal stress UspA family protein